MKRVKDENTNSRVYKMTKIIKVLKCNFCPPNKGCNGLSKYDNNRNWKEYRKTQWREI
jgi:hypothetical protein